ncbi:MAG: hypothetical protein JWO49_2255 [Arthrobacter sp.]|nr:hypothetical protein [Arthrobacter sp.]
MMITAICSRIVPAYPRSRKKTDAHARITGTFLLFEDYHATMTVNPAGHHAEVLVQRKPVGDAAVADSAIRATFPRETAALAR